MHPYEITLSTASERPACRRCDSERDNPDAFEDLINGYALRENGGLDRSAMLSEAPQNDLELYRASDGVNGCSPRLHPFSPSGSGKLG
jgi:hypothetical protein